MYNQVCATVERHNMLVHGDCVVLGLSGGADSMCLLHVLLRLQTRLGLSIVCAHVNHGLRRSAITDETFVREVCQTAGVTLRVFHADIAEYARAHGTGREAAGRVLRYESFGSCGRQEFGKNFKIATAHSRSDQAETVLMRILRGTGTHGLGGIPPVRGNIVRPLIDVARQDIEAYNNRHSVAYVQDETNAANDYTRNKIRNELLPHLAQVYNPNITDTLALSAMLASDDEACLEALAAAETGGADHTGETVTLCVSRLNSLHSAIARRVIRRAVALVRNDTADILAAHVEAALSIARGQTGKSATICGGVVAEKVYDTLRIGAKAAPRAPSYSYDLPPDTPLFVPEAGLYALVSRQEPANLPHGAVTKVFSVGLPLTLRTRRPGDRFGSKKLKDFFIDTKTPRAERETAALVAHGGDILWIPGGRDCSAPVKHVQEQPGDTVYISIWRQTDATSDKGSCNPDD